VPGLLSFADRDRDAHWWKGRLFVSMVCFIHCWIKLRKLNQLTVRLSTKMLALLPNLRAAAGVSKLLCFKSHRSYPLGPASMGELRHA